MLRRCLVSLTVAVAECGTHVSQSFLAKDTQQRIVLNHCSLRLLTRDICSISETAIELGFAFPSLAGR
jgi:hypothetical protein